MSSQFLLLFLLFSIIFTISLSFPLRQVGIKKNIVYHMVENREPILCWIVQIDTLKSCKCQQDESSKESFECCNQQEHLKALSEELNLEIHHSFGAFHDHFLLCLNHQSERSIHVKRYIQKIKSESIKKIHIEHSTLRTSNKNLFDKYKHEVEHCLNQHEEILWFSLDFVHRRQSHEHSMKIDPINLQQLKSRSRLQYLNQSDLYFQHRLSDAYKGMHTPARISFSQSNLTQNVLSSSSVKFETRDKRSVNLNFNDPAYPKQWHLKNSFQKGMDINVTGLWLLNYTGSGVTIAVVDDGVEWTNPDLKNNYNNKGSWDLNSDDPDPSPSTAKTSNHHGTRCAGEIAAVANNGICGVGVAYGAKFSGLRVLDGAMTDSMEAEAFNKKMDINDIYSCSWGPDDDGRTVDGPHLMAAKAMKYGVDFGRQGYGNIFVVASGNGGEHMDNCNFDGYANSIYTVTIGAVDENGGMPYYAEECASMLGVTFSSGTQSKRDIVTTDWTVGTVEGCTDSHTGTSAAAPLAAGMIALMLQARYCLTWRDVQYIIILTSQKVDIDIAHWQENGAGLSHSHKHGFGLLNSWRLVNAAKVWETVPWLTSYSHTHSQLTLAIPKHEPLRMTYSISDEDIRGLGLYTLESVQVTVWLTHPFRGLLAIQLISPANTVSVLAAPRPLDNSSSGFTDWTFTTVRCWGEQPQGNWTILFIDNDNTSKYGQGYLTKLRLTLFGTPMTASEFAERRRQVEAAMNGEFLQSNFSLPCSKPIKFDDSYTPVGDKVLKVIILSGAFCFLMAVYETLEYLLCYNDEKKEAARNRQLTCQAQCLVDPTLCANTNETSSLLISGRNTSTIQMSGLESNDEDDINETSSLLISGRNTSTIQMSGLESNDEDDINESSNLVQSGSKNSEPPEYVSLSTFYNETHDSLAMDEIIQNSRP